MAQQREADISRRVDQGFETLRALEKSNQRVLSVKGELSDEATAAYDRAKRAHERLASGCTMLAEALLREVAWPMTAPRVTARLHSATA